MDPITITVKRTGPYVISVEDAERVRILDHEGNLLVPEPGRRISLCRCGGSATKPFCDSSHKTNGFAAIAEARANNPSDQGDGSAAASPASGTPSVPGV